MSQTLDEAIASTVRAELARRRYTQADLALALSVTPAAVSRYLSGQRRWTVSNLSHVADFLGVPLAMLTSPPAQLQLTPAPDYDDVP